MIALLKEILSVLATLGSTLFSYLSSGIVALKAVFQFFDNILQFFGLLTGSDIFSVPAFVSEGIPLFIVVAVCRILLEVF